MVSSPSILIAAPTSPELRDHIQNVMENVCRTCLTTGPSVTPQSKPGLNVG